MPRILFFWLGSMLSTAIVITVIGTDWITWDRLNRDFFATTGKSEHHPMQSINRFMIIFLF